MALANGEFDERTTIMNSVAGSHSSHQLHRMDDGQPLQRRPKYWDSGDSKQGDSNSFSHWMNGEGIEKQFSQKTKRARKL
ncbi:MAG: hypothetical protein ABIV39_16295 [Verrucomicrobiota bacterium]